MTTLDPTTQTAARAPISPGQPPAPMSPEQRAAPTSPGQLLDARLEPNAVRLILHQPWPATVSMFRWSMRSWESVRHTGDRRRGLPRPHGPSEEQLAALRSRFGQCLGARHPVGASPEHWRPARPRTCRIGQPWHNARLDHPEASELSGLVTGPIRSLPICIGSGARPTFVLTGARPTLPYRAAWPTFLLCGGRPTFVLAGARPTCIRSGARP
jgi:hypothetical protein